MTCPPTPHLLPHKRRQSLTGLKNETFRIVGFGSGREVHKPQQGRRRRMSDLPLTCRHLLSLLRAAVVETDTASGRDNMSPFADRHRAQTLHRTDRKQDGRGFPGWPSQVSSQNASGSAVLRVFFQPLEDVAVGLEFI